MDSTAFQVSRDDALARNRFESFKLGKGLPSTGPGAVPKHAHTRSHSRNTSVSSFQSAKPTTVNDFSHFSFPASSSNPTALSPTALSSPSPSPTSLTHPNLIPSSKRNSHHRRRSSVSTRHESAEMMGVALPDLPSSTSDDNVNLGEKDSIRRRALWALEGKPDVSFSTVEIPDISTPDVEKMLFDLTIKPSSIQAYNNGLAGSKRDSFKLLGASSSSKDQLGTLVEEEEEEDESMECSKEELNTLPSPTNSIKENLPPTPALAVTKATPSKPRPSNLNLRPLSLTPDNLHITPSLPSPALTPSPRGGGLRSLALSPSSSIDESTADDIKQSRRSSLVFSRRPVLNLALEQLEKSGSEDDSKASRRSSISYKRSASGVTTIAGLPTPEMTPTFGRRYSNASAGDRESISSSLGFGASNPGSAQTTADDDFFPGPPTQARPLSASEQHFLFKSHNALLARITDLERALSMRRRESGGAYSSGGNSRPASAASNISSGSISPSQSHSAGPSISEPSDEMLNLIADLKAERDELKRDVDGWRTRVGDMESQISVLTKRVENERRDAWVARSRVGLLEVEKGVLSKKVEALEEVTELRQQQEMLLKAQWEEERLTLIAKEEESKRKMADVERELERLRKELEVERLMKKALVQRHSEDKEVDPLATPTPRLFDAYTRPTMGASKHGLGFMSVDSESSATDVESSDDGFKLKTVREESESESEPEENSYSEDTYYEEEEENGLAGYEDEDDMDMSLQSSSSFSSEEDLPRSIVHLQKQQGDNNVGLPPSPTTPTSRVFTPPRTHARRATLSKTWTFPFGAQNQPVATAFGAQSKADDEDEDKFFGCLEDDQSDTSGSLPSSPSAYSYEKSKNMFASGFKFASADDNASFFLPGVGFPGDDSQDLEHEEQLGLAVVEEENEDEEEESLDAEESDSEADDMFGEIGGIRITFTPPQDDEVKEEKAQIQVCSPVKRTSPPPMLPALDFGFGDDEPEDEDDEDTGVIPFSFGRSLLDERAPSPPSSTAQIAFPTIMTPPSSLPRSSPSLIPRPSSPSTSSISRSMPSFKAVVSSANTPISTPPKIIPLRAAPASVSASFITPPTKRGGVMPSFIPQSVSSPSPIRTSSTAQTRTSKVAIPTSTFIRQPTRKPLLATTNKAQSLATNGNANVPPVSAPMNARASFRRSPDDRNTSASSPQMKSIDLSDDRTFSSSSSANSSSYVTPKSDPSSGLTSPFSATRLSFQTITNFIPLSWTSAPLPQSTTHVASHSATSSISDNTVVPEHPTPRLVASTLPPTKQCTGAYVSREKQLRKLKARMELEGLAPMSYAANVQCKNCNGGLVLI